MLISYILVSVVQTQGEENTAPRLLTTNHRYSEAATTLAAACSWSIRLMPISLGTRHHIRRQGLIPAYLNTVLLTAVARLNGSYRQIVHVLPRRS